MSALFVADTSEEGPNLDEYIAALEALRKAHGGALRVQSWSGARGRFAVKLPALAFTRLNKKADSRPRAWQVQAFFQPAHDSPDEKGVPVIRV